MRQFRHPILTSPKPVFPLCRVLRRWSYVLKIFRTNAAEARTEPLRADEKGQSHLRGMAKFTRKGTSEAGSWFCFQSFAIAPNNCSTIAQLSLNASSSLLICTAGQNLLVCERKYDCTAVSGAAFCVSSGA